MDANSKNHVYCTEQNEEKKNLISLIKDTLLSRRAVT